MATVLFELLLILYINLRDRNRCLPICVQGFEKILEIWHPLSRGMENSLGAVFDYQIRRLANIVDPIQYPFISMSWNKPQWVATVCTCRKV